MNKIKEIFNIFRRKTLLFFAKVKSQDSSTIYLSFFNKKGYFLPYSSRFDIDNRQLIMVSKGLSNWLLKKYTMDDIQMKETDTVIDCGAFVGGFTIAAAKIGVQKIYSIDPSTKNFKCLELNIDHYNYKEKVSTLNMGLNSEEGELKLNLSKSGCDDSFLEPDEGALNTYETVKVTTLCKLIEKFNIDTNSLYLKVEAEGLEPEIIYGLGEYRPRVITVDISPERDGKSPKEEIETHLKGLGYKVIATHRCLYAAIPSK
jgi:FkbM family methyltransferase